MVMIGVSAEDMIRAARAVPDEHRIEDQKREIMSLINRGGDVNATGGDGKTVLQYAIDASRTAWDEEDPHSADIVSLLISQGARVTNDIIAYAELDHALNAPPPVRDILSNAMQLDGGVFRKRKSRGKGKKTLRTRRSTRRRTIKHKRR
jgi:ankyrin repeat protein